MTTNREVLLERIEAALHRDGDGAPLISPEFVLHQGPDVHVVDLRSPDEASGPLGYIPGSVFIETHRIETLSRDLPDDLPMVLVSRTGRDAARVALQLERRGKRYVAAMAGGLSMWRTLGFSTSRDTPAVADSLELQPDAAAVEGLLSLEQVRTHIGDPRNIRWVRLATMATLGSFSCIDGRDERGVIGTPGGDAGEFLLSLAALERATGVTLDEAAVTRTLLARVDASGVFSSHTDGHAFEALLAALHADPKIGEAVGHNQTEALAYLSRPPHDARDTLIEYAVQPEFLGCGHVRLMLEQPDEYGLRRALVESFIRAWCRLWWDGAPELDLTVLPGEHREAAVVNIRLEEELWGASRIPLVSPTGGGSQMFVNHPDVANYIRRRVVEFHRRGLGPLTVREDERLRGCLDELANQQLTATVGYLAKGLPIYEVVFASDGEYEVRA